MNQFALKTLSIFMLLTTLTYAAPAAIVVTRYHTAANHDTVTKTYTTGTTTVTLPLVEIFISNGVTYTYTLSTTATGTDAAATTPATQTVVFTDGGDTTTLSSGEEVPTVVPATTPTTVATTSTPVEEPTTADPTTSTETPVAATITTAPTTTSTTATSSSSSSDWTSTTETITLTRTVTLDDGSKSTSTGVSLVTTNKKEADIPSVAEASSPSTEGPSATTSLIELTTSSSSSTSSTPTTSSTSTTPKTTSTKPTTTSTKPKTTSTKPKTTSTKPKTTSSPKTTSTTSTTSSTSTTPTSTSTSTSSSLPAPSAIVYSPYNDDGSCKDSDSVLSDLTLIKSKNIPTIRVYGTDCNSIETVEPNAVDLGLKINQGFWINSEGVDSIDDGVDLLISWASENSWDVFDYITIGNEAIQSGFCTVQELIDKISSVKSKLKNAGYTGKVTTSEPPVIYENNPRLCTDSEIDMVGVNSHSYFDPYSAASDAGTFLAGQLEIVQNICGDISLIVTETGYPSKGITNGKNVPSTANQRIAIEAILDVVGTDLTILSTYNDYWKQPGEYGIEQSFGVIQLF